jgi:hypothetical protein
MLTEATRSSSVGAHSITVMITASVRRDLALLGPSGGPVAVAGFDYPSY